MEHLNLRTTIMDTTGGPVLLCQSTDTKELVAVKRFNIKKPIHEREVKAMQRLAKTGGHENLVQLRDVVNGYRSLNIIMEYCAQGDLCTYLENVKKLQLSEVTLKFKQIVSGVLHLHKSGMAHRNLSFDNILIDESGVCKICDFGTATCHSSSQSVVGLKRFRSPEIAARKGNYSPFQADIWSLGVILFGLLTRRFPFKKAKRTDKAFNYFLRHGIQELLLRHGVLYGVPDEAVELLDKLLRLDPTQRISLVDVLKHPFISRYSNLQ